MTGDLPGLLTRLREHLPGRDLTCDLSDALSHRPQQGVSGALPATFRPLWPDRPFAGVAVTARTHGGDPGAVYRALDQAGPGSVLVVDGAGVHTALWGERTTLAAQARGVQAAVIHGACRDVSAIRSLGFPVVSTGVTPGAAPRGTQGVTQGPVSLGGVPVSPGDVLVGDANGVVVLPASGAEDLLRTVLEGAARLSPSLPGTQ